MLCSILSRFSFILYDIVGETIGNISYYAFFVRDCIYCVYVNTYVKTWIVTVSFHSLGIRSVTIKYKPQGFIVPGFDLNTKRIRDATLIFQTIVQPTIHAHPQGLMSMYRQGYNDNAITTASTTGHGIVAINNFERVSKHYRLDYKYL